MSTRPASWLIALPGVGLLAALATFFQLTLARSRTEWILTALDQHNLVLDGRAGTPWQYRVLSDYVVEALFRGLTAVQKLTPYTYGLIGFVLFRGAQELCIFGLGFVYFRNLGLGRRISMVGLTILCAAMLVGQIQTNWQLDSYTELVLYLLACILALARRFVWVVGVAALAAVNRETGVLIPLIPLAFINMRALRSSENLVIYRAVGLGIVVFALVRLALQFALPAQDLSTRLVDEPIDRTLKLTDGYVYLAVILGALPFVGVLGLRVAHPFVRYVFWLIVPAWMVTNSWGTMAFTPTPFLVPWVLAILPGALFVAAGLRRDTQVFFGSATDGLAASRETIAALAVVALLGPVVEGLIRLNYPFALEHIEGPLLEEVRRAARAQPLYVGPTLEYVPLLYAPVYMYVSATVAMLTGVSLLPMRIVSLAATLGSVFVIYRLVSLDAPGRLAAILAAGLFLGATRLTPTDPYPARVDALCLFLVLAAIAAARRVDRHPNRAPQLSAACGLLIGLAIFTKQTAAIAALPLLALAIPCWRARVLPYMAAASVTLVLAALALVTTSGGWARFYLVDLPRNHGVEWPMLSGFWTLDILPHFGSP
jgi:hypothetical protein